MDEYSAPALGCAQGRTASLPPARPSAGGARMVTEQLALALDAESTGRPLIEVVDPWGRLVRVGSGRHWNHHVIRRHPELAGVPLDAIAQVVAQPHRATFERRVAYWAPAPGLSGGGLLVIATAEDTPGGDYVVTVYPSRDRRLIGTPLAVMP